MSSVIFLLFLLSLNLLEHLVLLFQLHLPFLKPVVARRCNEGSAIIIHRLVLFDHLEIVSHLANELNVGCFVDLLDLAIDNPEAVLAISSHTLQKLEPLAPGHA